MRSNQNWKMLQAASKQISATWNLANERAPFKQSMLANESVLVNTINATERTRK